jgi:tetratricopeptide (TPR) repeat protein
LQGQILRKLGKRREAALAYEAALKEDPTYGIAYQQLIEVYREAGEPASLRSAVDRWKRAEPAKPEPYLYSAAAHYDQGEYDQAIEQAHLAERYPHDHLPHLKLVLVNCYNKLRDPESAAVQMREFLERWPDDPLAPQVRTSLQEIQKFIHK